MQPSFQARAVMQLVAGGILAARREPPRGARLGVAGADSAGSPSTRGAAQRPARCRLRSRPARPAHHTHPVRSHPECDVPRCRLRFTTVGRGGDGRVRRRYLAAVRHRRVPRAPRRATAAPIRGGRIGPRRARLWSRRTERRARAGRRPLHLQRRATAGVRQRTSGRGTTRRYRRNPTPRDQRRQHLLLAGATHSRSRRTDRSHLPHPRKQRLHPRHRHPEPRSATVAPQHRGRDDRPRPTAARQPALHLRHGDVCRLDQVHR